jgi:mono/diheme cytochrome c family protein
VLFDRARPNQIKKASRWSVKMIVSRTDNPTRQARSNIAITFSTLTLLVSACQTPPEPPTLTERGEQIFLNEVFAGNGRTCGSCHQPNDNFGLTPAFIATLPDDDPLFVAEFNPDLDANFENPLLMRSFGLILENQDGFGDLQNNFNMRGIPHTLALKTSIDSRDGPRTGWSGDGAPGDGSLRSFATGAVIQHFTKTTQRIAGVDFRLPTDDELDALEAFQLSLGRQEDLSLPLPLNGVIAARGQEIFMDNTLGKCNVCHFNAGANGDPSILGPNAGNLNFATGVEDLPDQPADLTDELVPEDDGFGSPGNGEFNTPPLVEAADTGPFFHNNSVETIEAAVAFYNGDAFTNSPAGQLLINATGSAINLDATQVVAVAAFLRVINALDNIRASSGLLERAATTRRKDHGTLLDRAFHETEDANQVLRGGGLHPNTAARLSAASDSIRRAQSASFRSSRNNYIDDAISNLNNARELLSGDSDD